VFGALLFFQHASSIWTSAHTSIAAPETLARARKALTARTKMVRAFDDLAFANVA
jgi:hypothetical protein